MAENNAPNGPAFEQSNQHSSQVLRQLIQSLVAQAGVVGAGDLAVTQNGTPNMSVNVAAGFAFIGGTSAAPTQGFYHAYNDAVKNVTIAASDPTNARIDLIVARVLDQSYGDGSSQWQIQAVTGTPSGSPAVPATPANSIVLAQIAVAANAASIVTGNITDKRVRSWLLGEAGNAVARMTRVAAQSVPNNAETIIQFDTKTFDPSGALTTGAGAKFTAQVAGYYLVTGIVGWVTTPTTYICIYKNGVLYTRGSQLTQTSAQESRPSVTDIVQLNVGDYVQIAAFQFSGGALNTETTSNVYPTFAVALQSRL